MIIETLDPNAVRAFTKKIFPHGCTAPATDNAAPLPPRSEAIALFKDAKRARITTAEPLLIRAVSQSSANCEKKSIDLYRTTQLTGAVCLLIDEKHQWGLNSTIAIIENLEAFLHFELLKTGANTAVYAAGRLSDRIITWLASENMHQCRYIHCGDYDPVGLDEFRRLHGKLGHRVKLHLPSNIETLFKHYGKHDLLKDSTPILARLRNTKNSQIQQLVKIMDETGCGLEQEALLLPPP